MRLALRELRRRPGRFAVATVILTLIATLLMFLGGLLDGLTAGNTGAYRAQRADVIVFTATSEGSLVRSRIAPDLRGQVERVDGVGEVGGLGSVQLGARLPDRDERDLVPVVMFGYERAPEGLPDPPPRGNEVVADDTLRAEGVEIGDELLLGPRRTPVRVIGFVEDTGYSGQATVWGSLDAWRSVLNANRPGEQVAPGSVQALVVDAEGEAGEATAAIDAATDERTSSYTVPEAIDALPGVSQQTVVFNQIIGVTIAIAIVVVALFFALITVERTALYGILKAVGAGSSTLFGGVLLQALIVTLVASAIGAALALALDAAIPVGGIPFTASAERLLMSVGFLLFAAIVGCAFSLRRVLRSDPAAAIGGAR